MAPKQEQGMSAERLDIACAKVYRPPQVFELPVDIVSSEHHLSAHVECNKVEMKGVVVPHLLNVGSLVVDKLDVNLGADGHHISSTKPSIVFVVGMSEGVTVSVEHLE